MLTTLNNQSYKNYSYISTKNSPSQSFKGSVNINAKNFKMENVLAVEVPKIEQCLDFFEKDLKQLVKNTDKNHVVDVELKIEKGTRGSGDCENAGKYPYAIISHRNTVYSTDRAIKYDMGTSYDYMKTCLTSDIDEIKQRMDLSKKLNKLSQASQKPDSKILIEVEQFNKNIKCLRSNEIPVVNEAVDFIKQISQKLKNIEGSHLITAKFDIVEMSRGSGDCESTLLCPRLTMIYPNSTNKLTYDYDIGGKSVDYMMQCVNSKIDTLKGKNKVSDRLKKYQ